MSTAIHEPISPSSLAGAMPAALTESGWKLGLSQGRVRSKNDSKGLYSSFYDSIELAIEAAKALEQGMVLVLNGDGTTEFEEARGEGESSQTPAVIAGEQSLLNNEPAEGHICMGGFYQPGQPLDCPICNRDTAVKQIPSPGQSEADFAAATQADVIIEEAKQSEGAARTEAVTHSHEHSSDDACPVELIEVDLLRTDGGTQARSLFDQGVVDDYAERMSAGQKFPAIDVFVEGADEDADFWVGNGFYRTAATKQAGIVEIFAKLHPGTQREAILFSVGANSTHGQPRTIDDKRNAVAKLLSDDEWKLWSDRSIADAAHVSHPFVGKVRKEIEELTGNVSSQIRKGKDDRVIDTSNIGSASEEDERQTSISEIAGAEPQAVMSMEEMIRHQNETGHTDCESTPAGLSCGHVTDPDHLWTPDEIVGALKRHGDVLSRLQLEEMGCSFAAIQGALQTGAIAQAEIGKFTLPDHKPQPTASAAQSTKSESATKQKQSIEEMVAGGFLTVSFTWLPGVKGKVNVSINTTTRPENVFRKAVSSDSVRGFAGDVMDLIAEQLKAPVKPIVKKAAASKPAAAKKTSKKKAPAKKAATKKPAKKVARKKGKK